MARNLCISLIQQKYDSNKQTSYQNTFDQIKQCAKTAHHLPHVVLLYELHHNPYFCQIEDPNELFYAEALDDSYVKSLQQMAKETNSIIVSTIVEKRQPGIYHNTAVCIDENGKLAGYYRKMHIPDYPGYYEKYYFTPGDLGFKPIETSAGKLGILICWDQWFPEAARLMALAGADILLYPTSIGWDPKAKEEERNKEIDAWITIQRAHSIANCLPVAVCNRVGYEANLKLPNEGTEFWGSSFITDHFGKILVQANSKNPEIIQTIVDLDKRLEVQHTWPFFRDRRTEYYGDLLKLSLK